MQLKKIKKTVDIMFTLCYYMCIERKNKKTKF
nr:MAG TPA: hypothetical protein [Caudoviricetes sp.]